MTVKELIDKLIIFEDDLEVILYVANIKDKIHGIEYNEKELIIKGFSNEVIKEHDS